MMAYFLFQSLSFEMYANLCEHIPIKHFDYYLHKTLLFLIGFAVGKGSSVPGALRVVC